jgi:hypothetical protein
LNRDYFHQSRFLPSKQSKDLAQDCHFAHFFKAFVTELVTALQQQRAKPHNGWPSFIAALRGINIS